MPGEALELEITESAMMLRPDARAARDPRHPQLGVRSPSTISAPAFRRSATCATCRCMRSSSTSRSSCTCTSNADDRIIVESTVHMAHALGLELVAEGVEIEWTAQFLADAGYDYGQGYRYSPRCRPTNAAAGSRTSTARIAPTSRQQQIAAAVPLAASRQLLGLAFRRLRVPSRPAPREYSRGCA